MDYLKIICPGGDRRSVKLDGQRMLIGREATCDIHLFDPRVSRRHAELQRTGQGAWLLTDLDSLNHVYVDERPVRQVRIANYWLSVEGSAAARASDPDTTPLLPAESEPGLDADRDWLEHLEAFQRVLLSQEEPRAVLERLTCQFCRILLPEVIAIGLVTDEGLHWQVMLCEKRNLDQAALLEEADALAAAGQDGIPSSDRETAPEGAAGMAFLYPMQGALGPVGHVYVRSPRIQPSPKLQHGLTLLATQAGLVWKNLQAKEQLVALPHCQRAWERELGQARQIQKELFPTTFDVDARLDAFAVNLPSVQVSGDYYDLLRLGPDTVAFVIADAMGHGMPAALMMAAVRASLRMGLLIGVSWRDVFQVLDDIITQANSESFITGVVGVIDLRQRELQLVSAGHFPPSVLVDGRPVLIPEACRTRPWGLKFETDWEVARLSLAGDQWSILCYTDGILDTAEQPEFCYDSRRVATFHREHAHLPAAEVCRELMNRVAPGPNARALHDDQTVLVLRSSEGPRGSFCEQVPFCAPQRRGLMSLDSRSR